MRAVGRWAGLFGLVLGWVLSMSADAATPTAAQLQMLQQMSSSDLSRLEQAIKGVQQPASTVNPEQQQPAQPVVTPRDPYADDNKVDDKQKDDGSLKPFGYDLFAGVPSTFAPVSDIPVMADYLLGPGDVIVVQLFGSINANYQLPVDRRGMITFPEVGAISVAGMTFEDMHKLLQQRVAQQFIGVEASITLGELRSIRVFVLGDVERPGSYVVSSLSTMTNALFVSGGVKLIGSLRDIQLKRAGKVVTRLDLYDLLLNGDTHKDQRLQPGDVIFVPPIGKTVSIEGQARRPAIYELRKEKKLGELIDLAGGLLPEAYPDEVRLERISAGHERILVDINLADAKGKATRLQDGDFIHVYSVLEKLENSVSLSGEVLRPLAYQWRQGLRISDIVPDPGILKTDADLDYVLIQRQDQVGQVISLLSASLSRAMAEPGGEADIPLRPDDKLVVFSLDAEPPTEPGEPVGRQKILVPLLDKVKEQATAEHPAQIVSVNGLVRFPGVYPLDTHMRISDLIRASGKLRESAYTLGAELTRRQLGGGLTSGSDHVEVDLAAVLAGNPDADLLLQPYDILSIRETPHWRELEYIDIRGEVQFPGHYPIRQGETLREIIQRAGGLTKDAYADGAVFIREDLRERESKQFSQMADNLERELASFSMQQSQMQPQQQQAYQFAQQLVARLRESKAVGRLVIDLNAIMAGKGEAGDLRVADGDELFVPSQHDEVTVVGEVFFPTSHLFHKTQSRDDYIDMSGGLTANADGKRVYVVHANGEVESGRRGFWSRKQTIMAGDTIVVPLNADRVNPIRLWTDVTQIMYQLALSAATLKTLGAF